MSTRLLSRRARLGLVGVATALGLSGCGFSPYAVPLPGGADLGDHPYTVKVEFDDVLDLVPQSAVRVNDIAVGKITEVKRKGWNAEVTLSINGDVKLPDNAEASIRQTSLLGEKFVSLAPPANGGGSGRLSNGDVIGLDRSGNNPEIEEVLGATSLLFNGGGLEKTNTIVRELNKTLDGNEPEVQQLLRSTSTFLGELDDNKQALITSLEQVNRLAVNTNQQKAAITHALDDLPEALRVINGQRDDLVGLLQSLDRLSDVATGVIRRSKADTLADLRDLAPVLRELANAGDDLAAASEIVLSFPFTDAIVGNSYPRALVSCGDPGDSDPTPSDKLADTVNRGACYGDYANLDINLELNTQQALSLIAGILSMAAGGAPSLPSGTAPTQGSTDPTQALTGLVEGLLPGAKASPPKGTSSSGSPSSGGSTSSKPPPVVCSLLGMCRTPAASYAESQQSDVGRLLVGPAVAR